MEYMIVLGNKTSSVILAKQFIEIESKECI